MMMMSRAAELLGAELVGQDVLFTHVSKDTRDMRDGDLYVAIKGERFDGHAFIAEAKAAGAVGALVQDELVDDLPQLRVGDTLQALGQLAASWRKDFKGRLIGLTGSNGKTTVKEMCRHVLKVCAGNSVVLATEGNLNNDIGMPLTLLELRDLLQYAVIEMGANHVGEIEYLAGIAAPDVAILNNVGPAHLEGFGSLENTAKAKAEIFGGLREDGTAIINLDDAFAPLWLDMCAGRQMLSFSCGNSDADVYAESEVATVIHHRDASAQLSLPVPGRHNLMNALAATAACIALGFDLEDIVAALNSFSNIQGRLTVTPLADGISLYDDSYNANPMSVKAGIDVLVCNEGESILVLGDMGELGDSAAELHRETGEYARQQGVNRLLATGECCRDAVAGFGEGGQWFGDKESLVAELENLLVPGAAVLVKGSRMMHMESVVQALTDNNKNAQQKVN